MQALCGLQGIFDLFNCKTPGIRRTLDGVNAKYGMSEEKGGIY